MLQRHLDLSRTFGVDVEPGRLHHAAAQLLGERRDVVLVEQFVDELTVLVGDQRVEAVDARLGAAALPHVLRRHHDVDAVRLAVDVLVDPVQLDLELLGAVGERAQHSVAARLAHGRDDVATVREGEDRELDVETLADRGPHPRLLSWCIR